MRAMLPARGWPPNMPVTTMTGSKTARTTTAEMAIQIITFLTMSIAIWLTASAMLSGTFLHKVGGG